MKDNPMLLALAALMSAGQPASSSRGVEVAQPAWIVATVQHSEWCPAGNVRLDLRTGQFAHTAGAARSVCDNAGLERPVQVGTIIRDQLERVRTAFRRAWMEGVEDPACRDGKRLDVVIVSNGGTPLLVLTTGAETTWPPEDLTCWSDAAKSLHEVLEDVFRPADRH